jgi:hypothetical protein
VAGNPEGVEFAHIVTLRGGVAAIDALAADLDAARVRYSLRRGSLRFSLHVSNTMDDIL